MKISKLILTAICIAIGTVGFSQSDADLKAKTEARNAAIASKSKAVRPVVKDGYMGRKQQILAKLNVKEIPASLPKYKEGISADEYTKMVRTWMNNNMDLLNPEFRRKLEAKKNSK